MMASTVAVNSTVKSFNEKIEEMNLTALRKYACPTINTQKDWYLKCLDCKSFNVCRVGKRAQELIDDQTKPDLSQISKFNEKVLKSVEMKIRNERNGIYFDALRTDDPAQYFVDLGRYPTHSKAASKIREFINRNHLPASLYPITHDRHEHATKAALVKSEATKEAIDQLFKGTTTNDERIYRLLMNEKEKESKGNAMSVRMYGYAKRYPELDKKYDFRSIGRALAITEHVKMTASELLDKLYPNEKPEPVVNDIQEDEISIEEFLREEAEPETKPEPVKTEEPKMADRTISVMMRGEFVKKKNELRVELDSISKQIDDLNAQKDILNRKITMLDEVGKMFE